MDPSHHPARTRGFLDAVQVLTRLGGLVTANHLAAGLVVEPGLDVFGLEVSDVLHAMSDTSLARTAEALRRPIRFRVEHDDTTTRVHACGVRADWFLAAVADRYGVEPFITAPTLPLHHRLDMPLGTLTVRDWVGFCAWFSVELVGDPDPA